MSRKFLCVVLGALFIVQIQNVSAHDRRDIIFPKIDILDPAGTIKSFENFIQSLFSELVQAGQNALSMVDNTRKELEALVQSVVETEKAIVNSLLTEAISKIEKIVKDSPIGTAVKVAECGAQETGAAIKAAAATVENIISCTTNQINAVTIPAIDLVSQGKKALNLGTDIYKDLQSCFPNGLLNIDILSFISNLTCIGKSVTEITTSVSDVVKATTTDIQNFEKSVSNTRNAIVRCPRETVADFVIQLGEFVTNFTNCIIGANA